MTELAAVLSAMDLEVERAVLGTALFDAVSAVAVARDLEPIDFGDLQLQPIHRCIRDAVASGQPVSVITVAAELQARGEYEAVGGIDKLRVVALEQTAPAYVPHYIALIREASDKRRLMELGRTLEYEARNGSKATDVLALASSALEEIRARGAKQRQDEAPSELTALLAHRFPVRADLIGRGLLPHAGILVNGGGPKMGKSLLLGNALTQRARARAFLGFPTDPGVSLLVQSELRAQPLADRFRTQLQHEPEPFPEGRIFVKTRRGVMLDEPAGLAQIMTWIEETGADLVAIDPLARHMSGDENSNRDMGAVVHALDSLIERYGVAVWITHHPSKPKDGDPRTGGMRLRGASALFAAADTVMMLDRSDDGFLLTFELRHGATPEPMRLMRTEDLWLAPTGPDPELAALAALTSTAPLTYSVLVGAAVEDLKLSRATAKRRVAAGLAARLLEKDLDGLYRPGPAYHRAVSQSHEVSADA